MYEELKDSMVELSDSSFDKDFNLVDPKVTGKKALIIVFSPGCGHCSNLLIPTDHNNGNPEYTKLANMVKNGQIDEDVTIAYLNGPEHRGFLQRLSSEQGPFEVQGFPTIVGYTKVNKMVNGQPAQQMVYYSTYSMGDSEEEKKNFRKVPDFLDFVKGLGTAPITYVERR